MRGCHAEHLKDVSVELLLLGPKRARHKHIFNRRLVNLQHFLRLSLVRKDCDWIELSASAALLLLVHAHALVCKQDSGLVHETEGLLLGIGLNHLLYLLVRVL